jgi:hypothetical protein
MDITYGLKERTADAVFQCLHDLFDNVLPLGSIIKHFFFD